MHHLSPEVLARLVDEDPAPNEAEHLAACANCRAELSAFQTQTADLRALPDMQPPTEIWAALEASLVDEGVIRDTRRPALGIPIVRIAAGISLFLLGGLTGGLAVASTGAGGVAANETPAPVDSEAAASALANAEANYLRALARYAEVNDQADGLDPVNRLAALEGIVLTTSAALREAPADPVINTYHLTALGQRDALLRELETAAEDDEWF
jgi:hypothetical protein